MAKVGEYSSTLFRSLRPDDENFQASATAAAREAEQRWPLFKAVSPRKLAPTPVLSAQERTIWSNQEKPSKPERKPALSVPGVSNKMAVNLNKMGGRSTAPALAKSLVRAERDSPVPESLRPQRSAPEPQPEGRSLLFSKAAPIDPVEEPPVQAPARADDSLAKLFNRLEGKEKVVEKPAGKRASFLGRLGRR